jgi:sugar phosphate isomerase/epimerase
MGFENHGGDISGNPRNCKILCERVGSKMFGVLYDPCNLMQAGTDYRSALSEFGPHITHVHFKDGRLGQDGTWERCGLGEGVIDFAWLISQLETLGYTGDYAVEFELNGGGGADEMAQLALQPTVGLKRWHQAFEQLVSRL